MSDPAIEAARQAWVGLYGENATTIDESLVCGGSGHIAIASAREALAPLRELKVPQNVRVVAEMLSKLKMDTPADQKITDDFVVMLRNMADNMEPLIYPSEEL